MFYHSAAAYIPSFLYLTKTWVYLGVCYQLCFQGFLSVVLKGPQNAVIEPMSPACSTCT